MAQVVVEMSSDEAKLYRGMQRIIDQQKKLDQGNKKVKQSAKDTGKESEKTFGPAGAGHLKSYLAGIVSITAGLGMFIGKIKEAQQLADQAAMKQRTKVQAMGHLAQLTTVGAPLQQQQKEMAQMKADVDRIFAESAGATWAEAEELYFTVKSGQQLAHLDTIVKMKSKQLLDEPLAVAKATGQMVKQFGVEETGGFEAMVSKAIGASSMGVTQVPELMQMTAKQAAFAQALGISDEEALAAVTTASVGVGEEAGTVIGNLMKQIKKEGVRKGMLPEGLSLMGYVEEIQRLEKEGTDIYEILGARAQAHIGLAQLTKPSDKEYYNKVLETLKLAEKSNELTTKLQLSESIPMMLAEQIRSSEENLTELAKDPFGTAAQHISTLHTWKERRAIQRGGGPFDVVMEQMWNYVDRTVGGVFRGRGMTADESYLAQQLRQGQGTEEWRQAVREFLEVARNLRQATEQHADAKRQQAAAKVVPE